MTLELQISKRSLHRGATGDDEYEFRHASRTFSDVTRDRRTYA